MTLEEMQASSLVDERYDFPEGTVVSLSGVYRVNKNKETGQEILVKVFSGPILVVGTWRDFYGGSLMELAWFSRGWVRRVVPWSVAKDGRRLVDALGDDGFPVMKHQARDIEKWIDMLESINREVIPVTTVARQLGWQPDKKTFVTGPGNPHRVESFHENTQPIIAEHHPSGTLEEWKAVVEKVKHLPLAQMGIYAALTAVLLESLGLPSFTFHITYGSTKGKTTTLQLGSSTFMNPDEHSPAFERWAGTRVALERRLSLVNGLPVVIDETANPSNKSTLANMVYEISQGREKPRGSVRGLRVSHSWRTVVLSSGQRSLTSFAKETGSAARVVEAEGSPFGESGGEVAKEAREGVCRCYGTAGPAFVAAVQGKLAEEGGLEELHERYEKLRATLSTGGDIQKRRAKYVAAMWLAAKLAAEADVLPFDPPGEDVWRELFCGDGDRDNLREVAKDAVWRLITSNPHRFYNSKSHVWDMPPNGGWWGVVRQSDGAVAVNVEEVARACEEVEIDFETVKSAWAEAGDILRSGKDLTLWTRIGPKVDPSTGQRVERARRFVFVAPDGSRG